jgi:hypothetical protein
VSATLLVRKGADERLPRDPQTGALTHTIPNVYREILLQIARDYPGLPDVRTLTMSELRFFYEGLRPSLRQHTHPEPPPSARRPRPPRRRR